MGKKPAYLASGFIAAVIITSALCFYFQNKRNYIEIMAVTGATPLALKEDVKTGFSLEVSGDTEKTYTFNRNALNAFASVYLRTTEVSPEGNFEGTYRYTGIPVLHILEGVTPEKPEGAPFDRPLDVLVTFVSAQGEKRHFSYGELTMTDDSNPVILAYSRQELLPSKPSEGGEYKWNIHKGPLTGLRLVCPAEPDTARYLDNVEKIIFSEVTIDNTGLPELQKGMKCSSDSITMVKDGRNGYRAPISFDGAETMSIKNWARTGHGTGYKGITDVSGYNLRSVLKQNFPGSGPDDFFIFAACDGYRSIFSGREIFATEAGNMMMLISEIDGKPVESAARLGPVRDYYVDREIWGLTHIIMLDPTRD